MKKIFLIIASSVLLSSCYSYTTQVGNGSQTFEKKRAWNSYLFYGLVPIGTSNPKKLANNATDYEVKTKISLLNGIVTGATIGIYCPTTTIVTK